MQQSYDSELKRWDIRLLVISLTLTFIFLGLTIYLFQKSDDSYHQAKITLYENQLLLGNIEYDVDRSIQGDKETGSSLRRLMVKANTYAQIADDNAANWSLLVREVAALSELLNQNAENSSLGDQGGAEQLAKAHSSAKDTIKKLSDKIGSSIEQISPNTVKSIPTLLGDLPKIALTISMVLALLCVAGLLFMIFKIINERTKENQSTLIHNQKNQEAILELLDVMTALSEGDLTVHARVSDDITGTLADSFNYSVEELHGLVSTVNQSSDKVMEAVKEAASVTDVLAKASSTQASQIVEATDTVNRVTQAMLDVSSQTSAAVDIAMSSTEVARSGSERVRSTIVGMDQIREHIQETSKRIKRLGESSQEIGDIVELIDDIADQTHILALNASIQASAAGDAGRGFAVVADEVQRLAERTGNATRRVENLVKTIQTDTNEAIFAMEKSTSEVVNGANLAERAGESLNEIESVSGRLATLIQNVSKSSREVSNLGGKMKSSMDSIKDLTEQNVNSTKITTISVEKIHKLANELRESVTGFKIK